MQSRLIYSTACLIAASFASQATGQTVIGGDDFDGGGNFITRTFGPDNTANNGRFDDGMGNLGSFFDRYGIIDPTDDIDNEIPFDFLDDSVAFPTDSFGILTSTDRDNILGFADLTNNENPGGVVTAEWTFDITGEDNLALAADFAAVGNFGVDETVTITASIDGGPAQALFVGTGASTAAPYTLSLESGTVVDRFDNPFFNENNWDILIATSGAGSIMYSASDVDQDGLNDDTLERTYFDGTFTNDERNIFDEAFQVNGTDLNNVLQTLSADITGTGSTLTVSLTAEQNGGFQVIVIDDLVLTSDVADALIGDFNSDGFVSQADLDMILLNWGDASAPAGFDESALADGGPFDGQISQNELDDVLLNWGDGVAPSLSAIPEPTSLALLGLGGLALAARRRQA